MTDSRQEADGERKTCRWPCKALLIIAFFVVLIGGTHLCALHSLSRAQLGLVESDIGREQTACKDWHIPIQSSFNAQVGARDYLLHAVAAAEVYGPIDRIDAGTSTLDRYGDGWTGTKKQPTMKFDKGFMATDLTVEHYIQDKGDRLVVLVAFRGTYLARDWLSNASWFLRWLPIPDHYDDAHTAFMAIRADALKQAKGRPVNFMVTGHSLGGGLAMHIAYGYPCVSAVVFNASPVVNRHVYEAPFDDVNVAHIFQNCEALGFARRLTGGDKPFPGLGWLQNIFGGANFTPNYHFYNYDTQNNSAEERARNCFKRIFFSGDVKVRRLHSMDNYVHGLARTAATCESDDYVNKTKICKFNGFDASRRIYCIERKRAEKDPPCLCKNWPPERRAQGLCVGAG